MEFDLLKELKNFKPYNEKEKENVKNFIDFLSNNKNCYSRSNLSGHVTAGAFIGDGKGNILLNHHIKSGMWFQFGGHSDGESNSLNVAKREVLEETGITNFELINGLFDVAVQVIEKDDKKREPEHLHYDVNFLFLVKDKTFKISNESSEIKWVSIEQAKNLVHPLDYAMLRMIDKYEEYCNHKNLDF